ISVPIGQTLPPSGAIVLRSRRRRRVARDGARIGEQSVGLTPEAAISRSRRAGAAAHQPAPAPERLASHDPFRKPFPSRIRCGTGFFGIMPWRHHAALFARHCAGMKKTITAIVILFAVW